MVYTSKESLKEQKFRLGEKCDIGSSFWDRRRIAEVIKYVNFKAERRCENFNNNYSIS